MPKRPFFAVPKELIMLWREVNKQVRTLVLPYNHIISIHLIALDHAEVIYFIDIARLWSIAHTQIIVRLKARGVLKGVICHHLIDVANITKGYPTSIVDTTEAKGSIRKSPGLQRLP